MKGSHTAVQAALDAMSRRIDDLEQTTTDLTVLRDDVGALARGQAQVSAQVQHLADNHTRAVLTHPDIHDPAAATACATAGRDDQPGPPVEWLTITDADTAAAALTATSQWIEAVLRPLGLAPEAGCWPWHPRAVIELLAVHALHAAAYTTDATAVGEWLSRWLPGATTRVRAELTRCTQEGAHQRIHGGGFYTIPARLDPAAVARWWTDTHGTDPDEIDAFALTPRRRT